MTMMMVNLGLLFLLIVFGLIRFLVNRKDERFNAKKYVILLSISFICFIGIFYFFQDRYLNRFEYDHKEVETIEVCYDNCVTVELSSEEQRFFEEKLNKFYFEKTLAKTAFVYDWTDSTNVESRSAGITINGEQFIFQYYRFLVEEESYILAFTKDGYDYVYAEKNEVTQFLNDLLVEYEDQLVELEEENEMS